MFELVTGQGGRACDGVRRRDFLRIGALGTSALALPQLLAARAQAREAGESTNDRSVIWLWLAGGPTHIETFDPKMSAPSDYRSVTGAVSSALPGVALGGTMIETAKRADRMAIVRSFAHNNSGHAGGTHYLMTGYDNRSIDNGSLPTRPSLGSITARMRGPNHPATGMPTYVRLANIRADGPAFLGPSFGPFDPQGQARRDMTLALPQDRISDRRSLLDGLDRLNRQVDSSGMMDGLDTFERQAFNLVLGKAPEAFDVEKEDKRVLERYGDKRSLGRQLLMARRLCEAGCGFVTVSYGGWDMHSTIEKSMQQKSPQLDQAIAALLDDLEERGLSDKILLVVSGEFGRTPKVNARGGRDHWANLSTLALAGGGLRMGQVIGDSAPKADVPATDPVRPQDLMATVFHSMGFNPRQQFVNQAGRPVYLIEDGQVIPELV
jgi:hypothetical protein